MKYGPVVDGVVRAIRAQIGMGSEPERLSLVVGTRMLGSINRELSTRRHPGGPPVWPSGINGVRIDHDPRISGWILHEQGEDCSLEIRAVGHPFRRCEKWLDEVRDLP